MSKSIILAAGAFALFAVPAPAAVPKLSGTYIVNYNEVCQASLVNGNNNTGESHSEALTVTFDDSTKTATLSGIDIQGALVDMNGTPSGYTQAPLSGSGPYSNTKTTVTIDGTTFNIFYGPLKKGVAQSAAFNGITTGNCAASAMAILQ
jgi:hypothetical protein